MTCNSKPNRSVQITRNGSCCNVTKLNAKRLYIAILIIIFICHSAPVSRSMQRNNDEQSQYTEDRRVALMLQNEEFLRELQQNEQFLQELSRGITIGC